MTRHTGPPDDAARTASPSHPGPCVKGARQNPHRQVKRNAPRHQVGLYAAGWKDGFQAGAVDALRRAGRWLPGDPDTWPDIWAALDVLADAYELAGGDVADGLIAEQRVSRRLAGRDD